MAGVTGSIPVAPTIAAPQSLVQISYSLYSHEFVRDRLLRAAHPRRRRRLQPRRDAAARRRGRQGAHRPHGLSRAGPVVLCASRTCCCRTRCSTRSSSRSPAVVEASTTLFPVLVVGAPLRVTGRLYNTAVVDPSRRILGVVPKTYLPNYREFYEKRHFVSGANAIERPRSSSPARTRRSASTCCSARPARVPSPSMSRSARTSGCRCRRRAMPRWRAPRSCSTCRPATSPSARPSRGACCAAASRRAPSPPMPIRPPGPANRPPTSPGTATPRSTNAATSSPRSARFDREFDDRHAPTSTSAASARSACATTASPTAPLIEGDAAARFRTVDVRARRADRAAWRSSGRSSASPMCRPIRPSCATIATRPTTSRSRAWRSGCSRAGSRSAVIGVSGGLDSTQALIVTCRAMDQLGLPRTNVLAYTLPGFGTSDKTYEQCLAADARAGRHRGRDRHQAGGAADAGRYRPSLRQGREGLRRHLRERAGGPAHRLPVPPRQPASRHWSSAPATCPSWALGWCTYGVGDHMSHYNPNGSVSKTLIQHLIRFVAASGDVDAETAARPARHPRHRNLARADPGRQAARSSRPSRSVGPYALQDFNLFYLTRLGYRPSKIAFLAWNAWHDAEKRRLARQRAGRPHARLLAGGDPALAGAVPAPLLRQPVQAVGAAQRTEDLVGRLAVAARRLACAVGRQSRCLARGTGGRCGRQPSRPALPRGRQHAELSISSEKVCFLIVKAREFDVQDIETEPEMARTRPTTGGGDPRGECRQSRGAGDQVFMRLSDDEQADLRRCCGSAAATARWRSGTTCATKRRVSTGNIAPICWASPGRRLSRGRPVAVRIPVRNSKSIVCERPRSTKAHRRTPMPLR